MTNEKLSPDLVRHLIIMENDAVMSDSTPNTQLLNTLTNIDRGARAILMIDETYRPGTVLCHEGDVGDTMFLIRSGRLVVFKGDPRDPTILGYRGPGEIIGEMTLLEDRPRSATVVALDDTRVFVINRERFHRMVESHPAIGLRMMTSLSARLREADAMRTVNTQVSHSLKTRLYELEGREQHLLELQRVRQETSDLIIHDLRNPLGVIHGVLQMLELTLPEAALDDNRELLDLADGACYRMQRMVNSLLDASRLESGEAQLNLSAFRPHSLIHNLLEPFKSTLRSARITLETQMSEELPFVTADLDKIERVICNLVDNAIKHLSEDGQLTVAAAAHGALPDGYINISVTDTGPGIPPEERERIFERFSQVQGDSVRRRGFGLGLSFCKLAVEAHGGRIWVEPGPGDVGSRFILTLPLAGPEDPQL